MSGVEDFVEVEAEEEQSDCHSEMFRPAERPENQLPVVSPALVENA